jgi:hypothetical protein
MAEGPSNESIDDRHASAFERLLWFCAGANIELLRRCPNSDRVKYQGLGGVVLATAVLAFGSGSYAIYTVFSPKTDTALEKSTHWPTVGLAIAIGLVWALIILNLDRFIVSSTGKGDGTDAITFGEFFKSLPRLTMAVIIGVCISAPLEIRVLKPEIDGELSLRQQGHEAELNKRAEDETAARKAELDRQIAAAQQRLDSSDEYFEKRRQEIKEQQHQLELEAEGKTGSGIAGRGPAWQDKKDNLDRLDKERETDLAAANVKNKALRDDIARWSSEKEESNANLMEIKAQNLKRSKSLDGLMNRIQISHEIGGSIPLFIMALLLAIECGPIFFKMMMIKGVYDYLEENEKQLRTARVGIMVDGVIHPGKDGKEVRYDRFLQVERALSEEQLRLETEQQLSERVHTEFRARTTAEIQRDPQPFLANGRDELRR